MYLSGAYLLCQLENQLFCKKFSFITMCSTSTNRSRRSCCVVGCKSSEWKNRNLHFYSFPNREWEIERKSTWIQFVGREPDENGVPWMPSKNSRICSAHFVGGQKSNDPRNCAFNPTILPSIFKGNVVADIRKLLRSKKGNNVLSKENAYDSKIVKLEDTRNEEESKELFVNPKVAEEEPSRLLKWNLDSETSCQFNKIILPGHSRRATVVDVKRSFAGFSDIKIIEADMKQLAGVSLSFFSVLLSLITTEVDEQPSQSSSPTPENINYLLLFLIKLKQGITFSELGFIFQIDATTASRTFFFILEILVKSTATWILWSSEIDTKEVHSPDFRSNSDCNRILIIDRTDIKCESLPSAGKRIHLNFNYQFIIGVTPHGFISFISKPYKNEETESFIINDSGFLKLLKSGDVIMADKGFSSLKSDIVKLKATLFVSSWKHYRKSVKKEKSSQMDSTRISVERAFQRIRVYNILNHINVVLFPYVDKIMHMCCVLANMNHH